MHTKLLLLLITLLCHIGAVSQIYMSDRSKENYSEIQLLYPKELVCGLPAAEKVIYWELEFPRGKYRSFIHVAERKTDDEIIQLREQLKTEAKDIYAFTDSCLLIIDYDPNIYTNAPFDLKKCDSLTQAQKLPIPNFGFLIDFSVVPNFFDNVTIYVLDAKKGKFLEDSCLTVNGVGLSEDWLHGYSKGIVISGNFVVYWLEVW